MINRNTDPWLIVGSLALACKILLAKIVSSGGGDDPGIVQILKMLEQIDDIFDQ